MESDRVVKAMARWWQNVNEDEGDSNARNPMLYDPLQEGKTTQSMQYLAAILVSFGAISAGTALAWTSPVIPQLEQAEVYLENANVTNSTCNPTVLQLTSNQASWVGSLLAIGAIFGAVPSGYIADKIGRKYTAIIMDIPFIISWLIIRYANSVAMLYIGRFLIGMSTGSFCVVIPMYISEIAETSIRGKLGTFFQLFLTIGIFITNIVGSFTDWKLLSAICLTFPSILLAVMFFLPETPTYNLKKGNPNSAALSLKWLCGKECDARSTIQMLQAELVSSEDSVGINKILMNKSYRNGLIISLALMFFQQFSGINAVIFYTVPIFNSAGSTMNASICGIIVSSVQVFMTFGSALLIEKAGRKILLLFSCIVMAICLLILGFYFYLKRIEYDITNISWLPLFSVVLFIITFSIGLGPIPWLMMGELFATEVKGIASSISVTFNWINVFFVTKCFSVMVDSFGSDSTFCFFSCAMIFGTAFIKYKVFETKGKSSTQIQYQLSGSTNFEARNQLIE